MLRFPRHFPLWKTRSGLPPIAATCSKPIWFKHFNREKTVRREQKYCLWIATLLENNRKNLNGGYASFLQLFERIFVLLGWVTLIFGYRNILLLYIIILHWDRNLFTKMDNVFDIKLRIWDNERILFYSVM